MWFSKPTPSSNSPSGIHAASPLHFTWVVVTSIIACFSFAAATQHFFLVKNRWWETVAMFVIAFTLFRPDIYRDWFFAPFSVTPVVSSDGGGATFQLDW